VNRKREMSFFVNVPLQTNKQIKNFCAHKDERGYPVNVSSNKAIKKKFFFLPFLDFVSSLNVGS
jgi:hypothetical protein